MKIYLQILEIITIIVWFGAVILSINGQINGVVGVLLMLSGVWVVTAAILSYKDSKDEDNSL